MLARHRRMQPWRAVAYGLLALGGIVIWVDPTRNAQAIPPSLRWVWTSFIVIGAAFSVVGAIRDRWIYEFVALPLVMVGFSFMVIVLGAGVGTGRWAIACWLASIVVQVLRRWVGLWKFTGMLKRAQNKGDRSA